MHYYFAGHSYKLSRRKNGGQYCGPCPFENVGTDRFIIEPQTGTWLCRECMAACPHGYSGSNGHRYGWLDEDNPKRITTRYEAKVTELKDYTDVAERFQATLNNETKDYLYSRGLTSETISYFKLGTYNQRAVTIPLIYAQKCRAIKYRVLPRFERLGVDHYKMFPNHSALGLYNSNSLLDNPRCLIIANSLFDVMLLGQLGYNVVGPYAGEASWDNLWLNTATPVTIINIGDWDAEVLRNGKLFRPGTEYALSRAVKLSSWHSVTKVVTIYAPNSYTDVNAAYMGGENIVSWLDNVIAEHTPTPVP